MKRPNKKISKIFTAVPDWLVITAIISLFFGLNYLFDKSFAQNYPFLKYFPSREKILSFSTDGLSGYPKQLTEITDCDPSSFGGADVFSALATCRTCMSWKDNCPQCCINATSIDYYCSLDRCDNLPLPFSDASCSKVDCVECDPATNTCGPRPLLKSCAGNDINNDGIDDGQPGQILSCQKAGCPVSAEPGPVTTPPDACVQDSSGDWYCTQDNLTPLDRGCVPLADAQAALGYNPKFHSSSKTADFYIVTDLTGSCPVDVVSAFNAPEVLDGNFDSDTSPCYKYNGISSSGTFPAYVSTCQNYADQAEQCYKDDYCCKQGVCSNLEPPGMVENCDTRPANEGGACQKIINSWNQTINVSGNDLNCYQLKPYHCMLLQDIVQNCMYSTSASDCGSCFKEIDPNFYYEFVPKSGESLVVLWLIDATPRVPAGIDPSYNTYFYTMIRVFKEGDLTAVAIPSVIVHQKNFTDAFSVHSVAAIDTSMLEVGKKYYVRLFYFIPEDDQIPAGQHLTMTVHRMEMNIFRVRQ